MMTGDIDILHLAASTKNYSGAEIEGLVKSACSYALDRTVNLDNVQSGKRVTAADMMDVLVTKVSAACPCIYLLSACSPAGFGHVRSTG